MTPEIVKTNEKIKVGMFLSILSILVFLLSSYLVYFYNTEPQRILRGDTVSFTYVAIAFFVLVVAPGLFARLMIPPFTPHISRQSKRLKLAMPTPNMRIIKSSNPILSSTGIGEGEGGVTTMLVPVPPVEPTTLVAVTANE